MDIENKSMDNDNKDVYCCSNTQPIYFVKYLMMCSICIIVLLFCILKISLNSCDGDISVYIGMITLIIGIYTPQPNMKK